jgi:hypothetical protein
MRAMIRIIPDPGKELEYRGTEDKREEQRTRVPLFLWLFPFLCTLDVFPDSLSVVTFHRIVR